MEVNLRTTIVAVAVALGAYGLCVATEAEAPATVRCVLALAVADTMDPVAAEVVLTPGEAGGTLILTLPGDDPVSAPYMLVEPDQIKFQVARFSNDRIATLQFVGAGDLAAGFTGRFWGFVDGESRPDMSGSFTLRRRE